MSLHDSVIEILVQMTRIWGGLGPDSGFGFGFFLEFGFGSVSALPGSDSDRFRRARFGFGSDPPPQVRIRIGYRFGSDSASEPGANPGLEDGGGHGTHVP